VPAADKTDSAADTMRTDAASGATNADASAGGAGGAGGSAADTTGDAAQLKTEDKEKSENKDAATSNVTGESSANNTLLDL
jgi:hypothetical protein